MIAYMPAALANALKSTCAALLVGGGWLAGAAAWAGAAPVVFGRVGDRDIDIYTLGNAHGIEARIMTYGASIVSLKTRDRDGRLGNIVLGFDDLDSYLAGVPYYGATVGRYANRIAKGRFTLGGTTYRLPVNDSGNSLHGGVRGFDKRIFSVDEVGEGRLRLTYVSASGEEGYPGRLTVHVTYRLSDDDALTIDYEATTTAPTPVNLTNHSYFNLTADPRLSILGHTLMIDSDRFTPVDETLIPSGELRDVAGTPFDFRAPTAIGSRIDADDEQLKRGKGYDHNWVLKGTRRGRLHLAAVLSDPTSGRVVEVHTTQPGLQFYSGNFLNGKPPGAGSGFAYRTGLCLETQHFPDSPNHPSFPGTILDPGRVYRQTTQWRFRTVDPAPASRQQP